MMAWDWNSIAETSTSAAGTVLATIALVYTGRQLHLSRQLAKHQFLLQLFDKMDAHNDLHEYLTDKSRQDPEWPLTRRDWIMAGRLLGLYEHISNLVADRIISVQQVDQAFSYRIVPILKVRKIHDLIYSTDEAWSGLRNLVGKLRRQKVFRALWLEDSGEIVDVGA